jgi:hypothetical protein
VTHASGPNRATAAGSAQPLALAAPQSQGPDLAHRLLVWLTWGTIGTLLFPAIYLVDGALRPGYDPLRQAISALSLGPGGWVQQLDFGLCGLSVLWSAYVWRRVLAGGVCATWYPIVRAVEGSGLVVIAVFSQDAAYGYPPGSPAGATAPSLHGGVHLAFTILVVNAMCIGLLVIARRFWHNPAWRGWTTYSIVSALLTMLFMTFFGIAQNTHTALTAYTGAFERLATNTDTVWSAVLVAHLWLRRPIGL